MLIKILLVILIIIILGLLWLVCSILFGIGKAIGGKFWWIDTLKGLLVVLLRSVLSVLTTWICTVRKRLEEFLYLIMRFLYGVLWRRLKRVPLKNTRKNLRWYNEEWTTQNPPITPFKAPLEWFIIHLYPAYCLILIIIHSSSQQIVTAILYNSS